MEPTPVELLGCRSVGPDVLALDVETPAGFQARPGQFVQLRATVDGEEVTRHYSISSPRVTDRFEVTVAVDPTGTLSPHLESLSPGDTIAVDGPYGRVFYDGESAVTVLASGPGIGPAVAIAERTLADDGAATVVYRTDELVHESRLAAMARGGGRCYILDSDGGFASAVRASSEGQFFVYGFEPFVEQARDVLGRVAPGSAPKIENFG